jgi:hypothetical protein
MFTHSPAGHSGSLLFCRFLFFNLEKVEAQFPKIRHMNDARDPYPNDCMNMMGLPIKGLPHANRT